MDKAKQKQLEAKGWRFGSVTEFLQLTPEEELYVDIKLRLSNALKQRRLEMQLSQHVLALRAQSSQSRVAKMEKADATVSIDLLIKTLLSTGVDTSWFSKIFTSDEEQEPSTMCEYSVTTGNVISEFDTASYFRIPEGVFGVAKTYEEQMERVQSLVNWNTADCTIAGR